MTIYGDIAFVYNNCAFRQWRIQDSLVGGCTRKSCIPPYALMGGVWRGVHTVTYCTGVVQMAPHIGGGLILSLSPGRWRHILERDLTLSSSLGRWRHIGWRLGTVLESQGRWRHICRRRLDSVLESRQMAPNIEGTWPCPQVTEDGATYRRRLDSCPRVSEDGAP